MYKIQTAGSPASDILRFHVVRSFVKNMSRLRRITEFSFGLPQTSILVTIRLCCAQVQLIADSVPLLSYDKLCCSYGYPWCLCKLKLNIT